VSGLDIFAWIFDSGGRHRWRVLHRRLAARPHRQGARAPAGAGRDGRGARRRSPAVAPKGHRGGGVVVLVRLDDDDLAIACRRQHRHGSQDADPAEDDGLREPSLGTSGNLHLDQVRWAAAGGRSELDVSFQ